MVNKCVKLFLVLALVVLLSVAVTLLPFSLTDKFKRVFDKVKSSFSSLTGFDFGNGPKVHLNFSNFDTYKYGEFNIALDKSDNDPVEGFVKYIHKGEKDAPLYVEKFLNGEDELDGVEVGLYDYCGAFFKMDQPYLLMLELSVHDKNSNSKPNENKANKNDKGVNNNENDSENNSLMKYFYPNENNKWVELAEGEDLVNKLEFVFTMLSTNLDETPDDSNLEPDSTPDNDSVSTPEAPGSGNSGTGTNEDEDSELLNVPELERPESSLSSLGSTGVSERGVEGDDEDEEEVDLTLNESEEVSPKTPPSPPKQAKPAQTTPKTPRTRPASADNIETGSGRGRGSTSTSTRSRSLSRSAGRSSGTDTDSRRVRGTTAESQSTKTPKGETQPKKHKAKTKHTTQKP